MGELYPGSYQVEAMKYGRAPSGQKLIDELASGKYIAQVKKDGANYTLEKTANGHVYLFGRTRSKRTGELTEKSANVPHIISWAMETLPCGTIICGEVYKPGGTSKDVTKAMGALPDKAIALQGGDYGKLHYYCFDMIAYDGKDMIDMPFEKRYSELCLHVDIEMYHPDYIEVAPSKTGYDTYKTVMGWIEGGEEGAVVKAKDGAYQPSKRPTYNFKVKQSVDSVDFVITEVLPPEREYKGKELDSWKYKDKDGNLVTKAWHNGWAGAVRVGAYDVDGNLVDVGRVSSGIPDWMLEHMAKEPEAYVGSVAEIGCMSLDAERRTFRHPYLIQVRRDKPAEDCKLEEIFSK